VVQALIFTLFIQAIVYLVKLFSLFIGEFWVIASWGTSTGLIWSIILAILFGFVISYYANNDKFHKYLRDNGITRESSYASEWFGAFLKNFPCFPWPTSFFGSGYAGLGKIHIVLPGGFHPEVVAILL